MVRSSEDCDELQADTLEEVVRFCLRQLRDRGRKDFVLDDSGLFIDALGGFPGVYSSYVLRTIGMAGVLRLLDGRVDRSARFRCCIGANVDGRDIVVTGVCEGTIALRPAGTEGFGFDPIFMPSGHERTFAEINIVEKNDISHRGQAIRAFMAALERKDEAQG